MNNPSRTQVRPQVEQLEARRMLATNILFHAGVITIQGTPHADKVVVLDRGHGANEHIVVHVSSPGTGVQTRSFREHQVKQIVFVGGNGNDFFENDTHVGCHAVGGGGDDVLIGGSSRDVLEGGAGNDHILGRGGDDSIEGEAGDDRLSGGLGDDSVSGGAGNDDVSGDAGHNHLSGDAGNDRLHGGADDSINGGTGDDSVEGGGHDDGPDDHGHHHGHD